MRKFASLVALLFLLVPTYAVWQHSTDILVQDQSNKPIPNANVTVTWQLSERDQQHSESGLTDYRGIFRINMTNYVQLASRTINTTTVKAEYGTGLLLVSASKTFNINAHPDPVALALPLYRVTVSVLTPYGWPLEGASVYVSPWTLKTDSSGTVTFILPEKPVDIVAVLNDARKSARITANRPKTFYLNRIVPIPPNQMSRDEAFDLPPGFTSVELRNLVVDDRGPVYVNGNFVLDAPSSVCGQGLNTIPSTDITPFVKAGSNTLHVDATDVCGINVGYSTTVAILAPETIVLDLYRLTLHVVNQDGAPRTAVVNALGKDYPSDSKGIVFFNPFPATLANLTVKAMGTDRKLLINMTTDKEVWVAFDSSPPLVSDVARTNVNGFKMVVARISDEGKYASGIDSVSLVWWANQAEQPALEMYPQDAATFTVTLPKQPEGTVVSYYVKAADKQGNTVSTPRETYGNIVPDQPQPANQTEGNQTANGNTGGNLFDLGQINWWWAIGIAAFLIIAIVVYIYIRED